MKRPWHILVFFVLLSGSLFAQSGVDIRVKINGLSTDSLYLGRTYGKRAQPIFGAAKDASGFVHLVSTEDLPDGVYALVFRRGAKAKNTYVSILLAKNERTFTIETDINEPYKSAKVTGSPSNTSYLTYYHAWMKAMERRDSLNNKYKLYNDEASLSALMDWEAQVGQLQDQTLRDNPRGILSALIASTRLPSGYVKKWPELAEERQEKFVKSLFAQLDTSNLEERMRFPHWIERLDINTFKLWAAPQPASTHADLMLQKLKTDTTLYQYYFNYMVNSFGNMSGYGLDEVFVYLVERYVRKGLAPWTEEGEKTKMQRQSYDMSKLLVGEKAPNARLLDKNGKNVELDSIASKYTLLVFWDPNCGHCKKELPVLRDMMPKFADRDITTVTYCVSGETDTPACWAVTDSLLLPNNWLYLYDPTGQAKVRTLYNLKTYPRLFLVDDKKKIIYRRSGEVSEEELQLVFDRMCK